MTMNQLAKFVNEEMNRREMSIRQFAELLGYTHPTISKIIDTKDPKKPSLEFLIKLAEVTHADIRDLVAMVAPEVAGESAEVAALSARFRRLSKEQQEIVDRLLTGSVFKSPDQDADG